MAMRRVSGTTPDRRGMHGPAQPIRASTQHWGCTAAAATDSLGHSGMHDRGAACMTQPGACVPRPRGSVILVFAGADQDPDEGETSGAH